MIGKGTRSERAHPLYSARQAGVGVSLREALQLGHSYIGTEHIPARPDREGEGVGTQVLIKMDVDLGELRSATIDMIRGNPARNTGDGRGDLANAGGVTGQAEQVRFRHPRSVRPQPDRRSR